MKKMKILILEDNPSDAELTKRELRKINVEFESRVIQDEKNFLKEIETFKPDIILSDYGLPQFTGFEALEIAKKLIPDIPFIIVTGSLSEEMAADSIKRGAWDYVLKENLQRLTPAIENALKLKIEKDNNKLAEEALKESEKKHRTLIETTSEGFWLLDAEKKTIDVNQSLCDMLGYSKDEMLGKTPFDFIDEENLKIFKEQTSKITETKHRTYEIFLKKKNGINFPTIFNATSLVDENGNPTGSFAFVTDITERIQSEIEIRHLNRVLRAIRNVNQLITKEKDRDKLIKGACKNLIENRGYFNAWIALLDESGKYITSAESGLGKDFLPILTLLKKGKLTACGKNALKQTGIVVTEPPFKACGDCPLADNYAGRGAITTRLEFKGKIFGLFHVSVPLQFIKQKEEQFLFNEVANDIAFALHHLRDEEKRKQAENQIMKDLKIKTALIQEIYHRTRNNMAVISAMLAMESGRSENDQVKSTFREIDNKIRAMSMVHQKLYEAKDLSSINMEDYIKDLVELIMQSYGVFSERVTLNFDLHAVKVSIDSAVPFGLIINELISNIFKHAFPEDRKGEISIRLFKEEDETINLELMDNGIGFSQNFDPRKDGSMGLALVFSIAEEQLKGEISVKSENGLKWHIKIKDNLHKERV